MIYTKTLNLLLYICISSCLLSSCSSKYFVCHEVKPELSCINLVDRNGMSETISQKERLQQYANVDFLKPQAYQKVLRIFSRDPLGSINAIVTSYYPNGQLKQFLEVKDNRAFGVYREWFVDGTLKLETFVIGGIADLTDAAEKSWLFDGTSIVYDEEGNIIATIEYCKGELSGVSRYYHKNGKLWKTIPFNKNMADGTFEIYLETGELLQTSELQNDVRHGKTVRYFALNKIAADETYVEGRLISALYYDFNGKLVSEICDGTGVRAIYGKNNICELQEFKQGVQDGKTQVFDSESNLTKIYHVKGDMKHGEEIEFFQNANGKAQPKISIQWCEDKIHGTVKTWYETGAPESQREMAHNMKDGLLTAWYLDGSVMLLESYEHDKLVKGKYFKKQEKAVVSEVVNGNGTAIIHDSKGNLVKKIQYYNGKPQN